MNIASQHRDKVEQPSYSHIFDPVQRANPFPLYHHLQENHPIHWDKKMESWIVLRYRDVLAVLNDERFSTRCLKGQTASNPACQEQFQQLLPLFHEMVTLACPQIRHQMRSNLGHVMVLFDKSVTAHIQSFADHLLQTGIQKGEMDFIQDFAYPLVARIVAELAGLPEELSKQINIWGNSLEILMDGLPLPDSLFADAVNQSSACVNYLQQRFATGESHANDRYAQAIAACKKNAEPDETNQILIHYLLIFSAIPIVAMLIGNSLHSLIAHPDQFELLCTQPHLLTNAFRELLRYNSSTHTVLRLTTTDLELAGQHIETQQAVLLGLGAAHRDPEQFSRPDVLDITRDLTHQSERPISFGSGAHSCIGSPLTRFAVECSLKSLMRYSRLPSIEMTEWEAERVSHGMKVFRVLFSKQEERQCKKIVR
ncbi:MAG TPA: cytochrome P450 [Ktedonobacteraceae bacterium]